MRPLRIGEKEMGAGQLFTCGFLPHAPMILACGGSKGELALWDIEEDDQVLFRRATAPAGPGIPKEGEKGRQVDRASLACLRVRERPDGQKFGGAAVPEGGNAAAGPNKLVDVAPMS